MLQHTVRRFAGLATTRTLLSGGGDLGLDKTFKDKEFPNMPHDLSTSTHDWSHFTKSPALSRLLDQGNVMYDDTCTGTERVRYQEPAKSWFQFASDDTLIMEEHDKEEWNEKPYVTVNHLYEPPVGSEERPIRVEANGNPGDQQLVGCFGNCAPHIPQSNYVMMMKGYFKNKCPMCQQFYYIHNRPWIVMHPDWTDEPAADEGPAYTFAEIEAEFDRDFHEFSVYLNIE
jgi:hypothetical protein